ncbi:hypothetical protein [Mariniflexile sp. AS56]|uniref:hypothetical protein n=1 Tax=Mariniflexile sp. AS56 TaxID=3063957 RepID=UPI0026F2051A|nr:hypothetical protein [Mariniflexile sp. AS56]MDO7172787.1 hypothetical protein [Mariniflexile sp. AS56]
MNLYIIVEGEQTEMMLYPRWIQYFIPELTRVDNFENITKNSYYLFSGQGIPSIYNHVVNAIKDINKIKRYDYLIVVLDADEISVEERKQKVIDSINNSGIELNHACKLEIIVQSRAVETWFLGNRSVYKRNPQGERFKLYSRFFNVEINDPEQMEKSFGFKRIAHFHESYLREMLKEYNIKYRKSNPGEVLKDYYLKELINRTNDKGEHLKSLFHCFNIFIAIKNKITRDN